METLSRYLYNNYTELYEQTENNWRGKIVRGGLIFPARLSIMAQQVHMDRYRSGHNGPDSKTCDQFGSLSRKCPDFSRLPRHRAAENFPVFSPRFLPNFRAVSEIRNTQFNMQRYRSGHNENDSKDSIPKVRTSANFSDCTRDPPGSNFHNFISFLRVVLLFSKTGYTLRYTESCPSGRRCSTRNAVDRKVSRVRIPNSPPKNPVISRLSAHMTGLSFSLICHCRT